MFHSRAHMAALSACKIQNGARILEVAIGSGEMFGSLVQANCEGQTVGIDIAPKMAALSHASVRIRFPKANIYCQAADGRHLPFETGIFDLVVCCFFFELLAEEDVPKSVAELSRVLRPGGRIVITLVGQNKGTFNAMYKACSKLAPAFWGRQRSEQVASLLRAHGYTIESDRHLRQLFYSSRILAATRVP
jgi:ubiquinone/menaquinone biosynthesis C-methylase UbiE